MLTHQEILDKVADHLFKQRRRAIISKLNKHGSIDCVYRAKDGSMCAVGCLIDPKVYIQGIEHTNVDSISKHQDISPMQSDLTNAGQGFLSSLETFNQQFSDARRTITRLVNPNSKLQIGKSFLPLSIPFKQLNLASMQEQLLNLTVLGDPVYEAGKTVTLDVSTPKANPGPQDTQLSGTWLLSKVHHELREAGVRPRYVTNLEALKGSYEDAI